MASSVCLTGAREVVTHVRVHVLGEAGATESPMFSAYQCDIGAAAFDRLLRRASASRMHCCGNPRTFKAYHSVTDLVYENHALDAAHGVAHSNTAATQQKRAVIIAPARVYSSRLVHVHDAGGDSVPRRLLCTHWARRNLCQDAFPSCTASVRDVRYVRQMHFAVHHQLTIVFEVHRRSSVGTGVVHQVYAEYVTSADADVSIAERRLVSAFSDIGLHDP